MTYHPDTHHRRSIRLKGYDYSKAGAYFVTICTYERECLFGNVSVGAGSKPALMTDVELNEYGEKVVETWRDLPNHNNNLTLDAFVTMPNHVHFIVVIADRAGLEPGNTRAGLEPGNTRAGLEPGNTRAGLEPAPTLSEIVRQLKTFSARRINLIRKTPGLPVWQRNYYERVIRNDDELFAIREYITNNPAQWHQDADNPESLSM